ncbi:methionyl-tRNA formyltransferase [uncultured Shimia sp.]|uniref:methionyl-tRNA formyltransferase n=1 Tax=uncultured Shimia sp. TaxID=573152 RepID=UPI0025F1E42F|nr:methionyl-tRNA formyltransferase [uncultured Shimia sp.]
MRILFMGTPEFSVSVLNALVDAGHEIVAVFSQPPRPAGRGKKDRPTPVHARALELGLTVLHPKSLRTDESKDLIASIDADVGVVVAYGLILPQYVLDAPIHGCLNIHASLLPRWRGAAPIHRAIMAGDKETGVCIMQMDAGLDTGPVLMERVLEIGAEETTAQLHDSLAALGSTAIVDTLVHLSELTATPQPDEGVTYAEKIDKAESRIDWSAPAAEVDRKIRGLSPFPGAWTEIDGQRVKLLASRLTDGSGQAGELLDDTLTVACGDGAVQLLRLQRAGKGAQAAHIFLRGFPLTKGQQL